MARFVVNSTRFDPLQGFGFVVVIDNQPVAGLTKCSALLRKTTVVPWFEGGDPGAPRQLPGTTTYEPITLEAGITYDAAFEEWANKVNNFQGPAAASLAGFRKDITIEVRNLQGAKVLGYNVFRCWVSEYQALPQLDASSSAVLISHITIQNEGWDRDTSVAEPRET
jgi:phage tail-like protein